METKKLKQIQYLLIMAGGSIFIVLALANENQVSSFLIVLNILGVFLSGFVLALLLDPLIFLIKRYIFRKDSNIPFSLNYWNEFIENATAYWIILTSIKVFLFFLRWLI